MTTSTTATIRALGGGARIARAAAAFAGAALLICTGAVAAQADEQGPARPHGHFVVLGVQFTEDGLTFRKCVDVAAGRQLPLHAHHEHLHHGSAAEALQAAGHYVVPTAPLSEWSDCAAFEDTFRP